MTFKFPDGFLWGAATSSHQVEGGNRNDWTEWEEHNAERLARESESHLSYLKNWPDIKGEAQNPANYISGRATDHFHRFREDFDIAKQLGHNAHRFSIEWSRVEPEEGRFNKEAIEHYRHVIAALRARNIEPFVTLWHWTLPLWLRDRGGVLASDFPERFARYVGHAAEAFKGDVRFWMTLNEPTSVISNGYHRGIWPPQKRGFLNARRAYAALADAHRRGYAAIHAAAADAEVGFGNIMLDIEPYGSSPFDRLTATLWDYWANQKFLRLIGDTNDYFALQYYFHLRIQLPKRIRNANERVSDMGWELYPEGLYRLLMRLHKKGKPIYITESGLADAIDGQRTWYIQETLRSVARAMREGADVRGHFYWSLLDNFEWDKGFWPRFGLVAVDHETLERTIRPSAWEYKAIIENNSIEGK